MTKLDELVSFILSDKLKEIRNFNCYDELVTDRNMDAIIAQMKAFNIEANDAMSVADKFNEVDRLAS